MQGSSAGRRASGCRRPYRVVVATFAPPQLAQWYWLLADNQLHSWQNYIRAPRRAVAAVAHSLSHSFYALYLCALIHNRPHLANRLHLKPISMLTSRVGRLPACRPLARPVPGRSCVTKAALKAGDRLPDFELETDASTPTKKVTIKSKVGDAMAEGWGLRLLCDGAGRQAWLLLHAPELNH